MNTWYRYKRPDDLAIHTHGGNLQRTRAGLVRAFQESAANNACVLFGYPGAGKSSLVDSAASESAGGTGRRVDVVEIDCPALVGTYARAGAGAALTALHRLRERYMRDLPGLRIFLFDEVDAIGPQRDRVDSARQALCYFCMDSLNNRSGRVYWLLTTNYPDLLDAAVLSRVGRRLFLPTPDRDAARLVIENWVNEPGETDRLLDMLFAPDMDYVVDTRGLVRGMEALNARGSFQQGRLVASAGDVAGEMLGLAGFPRRTDVEEYNEKRAYFIRNSESLLSLWGI